MGKPVRMVRCAYSLRGESEWVRMGRARTRCPRCGAEVKVEGSLDEFHVVTLREAEDG